MRRFRNLVTVATAAVLAAVVMYLWLTLPPATRQFSPAAPTTIYGAFHIHSNRSDGSGSLDAIAAAAASAGLQFVIVTDHGDATREPGAPTYLHDVLVIDAVEIGTDSGHLVALGLAGASPYPLGAEARDTIEDVHRMGGWVVAAHPESPKAALSWRNDGVVVDGIEWLNADSEWRDEPIGRLVVAAGHYVFRPVEAVASVFDRPSSSLRRWDALLQERAVVGLSGVDAHARIGIDESAASAPGRTLLARPGYEDMFRLVVQAIDLPRPLSQDAALDAAVILAALRSGRTYSVVSAFGTPGRVSFTASDRTITRQMGESLETEQPVTLQAAVAEPADAIVVLLRRGEEVASGLSRVTFEHHGAPAAYRVEVRLPGRTVPWIVTNAIRVGPTVEEPPTPVVPPADPVRELAELALWSVEKHPSSRGDVRIAGPEVLLDFGLAAGESRGQYAAISYPLRGQERFDSVTMTIRASAPMRVSVQLRAPGGVDGERWQRSVYVDTVPRTVNLQLADFAASQSSGAVRPVAEAARSLLLVVDTAHTRPGTEGRVWISTVSLGAQPAAAVSTSAR